MKDQAMDGMTKISDSQVIDVTRLLEQRRASREEAEQQQREREQWQRLLLQEFRL